jgi:hypothetical protein
VNTGMLVLVGGFVGAGVLFYTSSGSSAARPEMSPTPAPHETQEIAHSGKTPKASPTVTVVETPGATPTPTPPRLTLAQVFALPRPSVAAPPGGSYSGPLVPPVATEPPSGPTSPPPTPTPQKTATPVAPPSEQPGAHTPAPPTPTPVPTVRQNPWPIPTPPPLPPYPDAALQPDPPSE